MMAFVLSRRDFRETDQIITLYTLEKGKIDALAKGIKKIVSKNSAFVEPFFLVEAEIIKGREFDRLASVQPIESFKKIRNDVKKSLMAGRVVGFVSQMLRSTERDVKIFNLLYDWLTYLNKTSVASSVLLLGFLVKMQAILGFTPILDRCVICNKKILNFTLQNKIFFHVADGGLICSFCLAKKNKEEKYCVALSGSDVKGWQDLLIKDWNKISSAISRNLDRVIYEFAEYCGEIKIDRGIF